MEPAAAEERGAFPAYEYELEKNHQSYKFLSIETKDKIEKYGRRNIALNTISPAGTISTLTQTSSGVEPVFMLSYIRNKKMTENDFARGIKPEKIDSDGIQWTSYEVVHEGLKKWRALVLRDD